MSLDQHFNQFAANDNPHIKLDNNAVHHWDNSFPSYTPIDIYETIVRDLPEEVVDGLKLNIKFSGETRWDEITLTNDKPGKIISFQYIRGSGNTVDFAVGDVDKNLRGQGISKTLQRNMFEFFKDIGTEKIEVGAVGVGTYAWAKMGFVPDKDLWNESKYMLENRLYYLEQACYGNNKPMSEEQLYLIEAAIRSDDPKAIWTLSDMTKPFPACPSINIGQAMLVGKKYLPDELKKHIDDERISFSFAGEIDLHDKEDLTKVCDYLYRDDEFPVLMETREELRPKVPALCI